MSPRKKEAVLKFVGRSDYFVAGVPQSDLKVVADPKAHDEVSPERAAELVATGLYEMGGEAAQFNAEEGGQGELTNG